MAVSPPTAEPRLRDRTPLRTLVPVALLLTVLTWPVRDLVPPTNIDISWQAGLHLAAVEDLRFGHDVLFTHGPLGFLVAPQLWFRGTAVAAVLFAVISQACLLGALLRVLLRFLPLWGAILVALTATRVLVRPPSETLSLAMLLVCLHLLQTPQRPRGLPLWAGLGVLVTAVQTLVKLNSGVYCAVLLAVTVVALAERRSRALAGCVAAGLVALVLLWLAAGERLGDLLAWARGSLDMTSGYTAAMAVEEPGRGIEYAVVAVLIVLVTVLLARYRDGARLPFVVVLLLLTGFIELKHGFVRHNRHVLGLLAFLTVLPLGLRLRREATVPRLAVAGLAVLATWVAAQGALTVYLQESVRSLPRAVDQVWTLASAERTASAQAEWRTRLQAAYALEPATLAALDGSRVQVDPFDTAVVWAHELPWAPVPVFQQYSTYTPFLDEANAEALVRPDAPEAILRARTRTIDQRSTVYEAPQYTLATICRYREEHLADRWQVLRRSEDRCSEPRTLGTQTVQPGQTVAVPAASGPRSLVYARIGLPSDPRDVLLGIAFKPLHPPRISTDGVTSDLVAANAGGPLLMRAPATAPVGPGPGGRVDVSRLALPGLSSDTTVEFFELDVAP